MKTVSRSEGRSATAAAAYRAGQKIEDERTGQTFDYSKRTGVLLAEVITPGGQPVDRSALWNVAEAAEKRCNSVVAREFVVALPHELSQAQQVDLVKGYAQGLSDRTGWAVDVAIHAPGKEGDLRNTHAHLLCTTRTIERDPSGCPVAGSKTRDWDIRSSGSILLRSERSEWERCVNQSLEQANRIERVDCRSHAEKQTGLEPQVHLGPTAMAMERKGIQTERGDEHRRIAVHNAKVIDLKHVQAERDEAAWWNEKMAELETLTIWQLERKLIYPPIFPQTVDRLALEYPAVKEAHGQVESLGRGLSDARDWEAYQARERNVEENRLNAWKRKHPRLNWLHERRLWESGDRLSLDETLEKKQEALEKAKELTQEWLVAHEKAEKRYRQAFAQVVPECQQRIARQQERYAEAKAFLNERYKQREQGIYREPEQGRGMSR